MQFWNVRYCLSAASTYYSRISQQRCIVPWKCKLFIFARFQFISVWQLCPFSFFISEVRWYAECIPCLLLRHDGVWALGHELVLWRDGNQESRQVLPITLLYFPIFSAWGTYTSETWGGRSSDPAAAALSFFQRHLHGMYYFRTRIVVHQLVSFVRRGPPCRFWRNFRSSSGRTNTSTCGATTVGQSQTTNCQNSRSCVLFCRQNADKPICHTLLSYLQWTLFLTSTSNAPSSFEFIRHLNSLQIRAIWQAYRAYRNKAAR